MFVSGLSDTLKDEMAVRDETGSLEEFVSLAIRLDNRFHERCRERVSHPHSQPLWPHHHLLDHTRLSPADAAIG